MSDQVELAGDFLILEETPGGTSEVRFSAKGLGRTCGSCQACCKLVPVPSIHKAAGQRCTHQKHGKGCAIYARRPFACRTWSCRWLADPRAHDLPRPDHAHYVVDIMLDYITVKPHDGSEPMQISTLQVWCDPAHPHAYRDPKLRAYLAMMCETFRCVAIIRYSSKDAFVLVPPTWMHDGQWRELRDDLTIRSRTEEEQAILDLADRIGAVTP